ncbi:hypothetical protein NDU88_005408 [Pleurodeles waltl]|uniref:Uncharacterized protein n=1 Tax=Pleurodeles waltl TaxID=8319 RepID=A0AAV7QI23_PLEWA|nr:hypothetical protein NDU88_005408 [Pleurodeles waltl]
MEQASSLPPLQQSSQWPAQAQLRSRDSPGDPGHAPPLRADSRKGPQLDSAAEPVQEGRAPRSPRALGTAATPAPRLGKPVSSAAKSPPQPRPKAAGHAPGRTD